MYEFVDNISYFLREPFMHAANSVESIPILFALLLGIVGALAPCQFSSNVSAITLYGTNSIRKGISWQETAYFVAGKIAAFSALGMIVYFLGQEFQQQLPLFFEPMRKVLGPVLILIGAYMLGLFQMRWTLRLWKKSEANGNTRKGNWGAFMLGFTFSLGFCPTMFLLFFLLLMPLTLSSAYGVILPGVFAIGTSIPFLFVIFLIWYLGFGGKVLKKGRKFGLFIQRFAGSLMIVFGILDMLTFW
ncbi:Cytochrome C biogenesis protein transmembrane region [Evansella caseinilytica]|uniref:Cytochrome C biogenesis protein transmembrane region n=1 Tax=Evansella caseinilytica TaxID=1503961 RepID=A0A1H3QSV5_9BACI|nr:sulfite exporter TauE/SafE family protein [Evansella caseinilytica]SDZ16078.1 Cytochrome C biogenesis protein transmembrane region [Evansella caseinilytica]